MKRIITFSLILIAILSSCKKEEPAPDNKLNSFSIKNYPDLVFEFDQTEEPILISNTVMLPYGSDLKDLTVEFELSAEGSLVSQEAELISGQSALDCSSPVLMKTLDMDGEIDHYYQLVVNVEAEAAPEITDLEFTLNPGNRTPLAGLLEFNTDRACRLQLTIKGQDNNDLIKDFGNPATSFSVPVLGLYAESTNQVIVTVTDQNGITAQETLNIKTGPLDELYPGAEVVESQPENMEPGMILVRLKKYYDGLNNGSEPLATIIDAYGKVRWYYTGAYIAPFKRLANGNWLVTRPKKVLEMDMLGRPTGNEWIIRNVHHDIVELPNGNFLALSEHDNSVQDVVVEVDRVSGNIEQEWDLKDILDIERPVIPYHIDDDDWIHLNGIDYDPIDDAFIVSGRNQSAVVKISRQSGEIIWIMGDHEKWSEEFQQYLLTPVGDDFEWSYGQHAPKMHPDDNSRIILFDNGNDRSYDNPLPAMESYSRGVEYQIDEEKMEIRQLWQYGKERGRELFCPFICGANYLMQTDNRLICFGGITRTLEGNASDMYDRILNEPLMVKNFTHIIEVNHSGDVVFEVIYADHELNYAGYRSYRADKISLYPEPAE